MTARQIYSILDEYERVGRATPEVEELYTLQMFSRMRSMLEQHPRMDVEESEKLWEKIMRWLGFMQGVLWCNGVYTIEQMQEHNKNGIGL